MNALKREHYRLLRSSERQPQILRLRLRMTQQRVSKREHHPARELPPGRQSAAPSEGNSHPCPRLLPLEFSPIGLAVRTAGSKMRTFCSGRPAGAKSPRAPGALSAQLKSCPVRGRLAMIGCFDIKPDRFGTPCGTPESRGLLQSTVPETFEGG